MLTEINARHFRKCFVEVLLKVTRSAVRIKLHIYSLFYLKDYVLFFGHISLTLFQILRTFNLTDTI